MFEILERQDLAPNVVLYEVHAPRVVQKYRPGQFVLVRPFTSSERIPLAVADLSFERESITLVARSAGRTTTEMRDRLGKGSAFRAVVGPLGTPARISLPGRSEDERGTVVCVTGGIGAASTLPIARAFQSRGHEVVTILGARNAQSLLLVDRLDEASERLLLCTDDGSVGRRAKSPEILADFIREQRHHGEAVHLVVAIGPAGMMKACVETTKPLAIPSIVSLNTVLLDGTGQCGGCRVTVGMDLKYVCIDGPGFDGAEVDFDELLRRQSIFYNEERDALARLDPEHSCHPAGAEEEELDSPPFNKER